MEMPNKIMKKIKKIGIVSEIINNRLCTKDKTQKYSINKRFYQENN